MNNKELDKMIEEHWGYIKELLEFHAIDTNSIDVIGFHYKTAMKHGYKHAKEEYDK